MSWGALNNQRERSSGDPLPDFLTGHGVKNFNDRLDPPVQHMDDVVRKSERPHTSRSEGSRGYGVSYVGAVNIQMSKKTLFVVILFFTAAILAAFGAGYAMGNISNIFSPTAGTISSPIKKPIVPRKKIQSSAIKPSVHKDPKALPSSSSVNEKNLAPAEESEITDEKNDSRVLSEEKNNKEINDSETIYQNPSSAPTTAADETTD